MMIKLLSLRYGERAWLDDYVNVAGIGFDRGRGDFSIMFQDRCQVIRNEFEFSLCEIIIFDFSFWRS